MLVLVALAWLVLLVSYAVWLLRSGRRVGLLTIWGGVVLVAILVAFVAALAGGALDT